MEKIEAYRILIDIRRIINSARLLVECQTSLSSEAVGDFRILGDLAKSVEAYAMMSKDIDLIKEVEQTQRYSLYDVLDHYELDEVTRDSLIKCLQSFAHVAPQNLANDKPLSLLDACLNKESAITGVPITIIQEEIENNIPLADLKHDPAINDDNKRVDYKFKLTIELEQKVLKVFQFWKEHDDHVYGQKNIFKETNQSEFFQMIINADFSALYNRKGIKHRIGYTLVILARILGDEWSDKAMHNINSTIRELQKHTDFCEFADLKEAFAP